MALGYNPPVSSFIRVICSANVALVFFGLIACGGSSSNTPASAPPSAAANAPAAPVVTLTEPPSGAFSGHFDSFRWSAVDGADGYRMKITSGDGRVVWESELLKTAEAHLPSSVSIEPESYFWQVTALKGGSTLATSAQSKFTVTP
jgi:hypothetical protein